MAVTLAELKQQSRERADMVNSPFISDSEQTSLINNSVAELHDILTLAYGADYNVEEMPLEIISGTNSYPLPDDFYKFMGLDIPIDSTNNYKVKKFNFNDRNNNALLWSGLECIRYRIVGNNLRLSPNPQASATATLWYVPKAAKLVLDTDSFDSINGYDEYVIVDVAIKMKMKQEDDVTPLMKVKADLLERITRAAQDRDAGNPDSITDVTNSDYDIFNRWG